MNSRTSSSASFDLVAQNENDVTDTLHGQNNKIEPTNDKESTADQQEADQLEGMVQQLNGNESAKMEELQKQQQHNIDESAKMEELQKQQQQHNIDESAEMEQLNVDHLQSDQKALLERRQQKTDQKAPIDQGTSQLIEECQNQQQQNIDALTEAQKGNVEIGGKMGKIGNLVAILTSAGQWRRYDPFRIVGAIVLLIFIIYAVHQLNAQKDYRFKMNEQMNEMRLEMAESLKSVQAMVGAELGIGNFSMAAHEEEEQTKLEELKHLREEIKQFELELKGMKEIGKQFNASMAAQEEEEQTKLEELKHLREKITQFELELKGIKEIDPYRIAGVAGAIVLLTFVIYTVHRLNAQNSIVVAELEEQKQANANKFAELEGHQNQQQLNIDALTEAQKRNGLIPQQNRWDSSMCHKDLALSEPDPLIVKKKREANCAVSSVLAVEPIPKEFLAFPTLNGDILIGLANKQMPLDRYVGLHDGTYAYGNYGTFWGHEVAGCSHNKNGRRYIYGKPSFDVGDVVGCGINLATRQIFYTKNGECLESAGLFVSFAADLFPCVSLWGSGVNSAEIEANFGPNFEYKF
uniref:B30.2/SPRY domain-containing protein n=1 Tax=Globodera rostochiensis TaxID=31243 RepID=A0A914GXM3_GLORO